MVFHLPPCPPSYGAVKRSFHLLEETIKHHEVSVLSFGNQKDLQLFTDSFGTVCKQIVFVDSPPRWLRRLTLFGLLIRGKSSLCLLHSRQLQKALDAFLKQQSFDVLHFTTSILALHRVPEGTPLIGDMQNIEYDNIYRACKETTTFFRKLYYGIEYRLAKPTELRLAKRFDALLATSKRDLEMLHQEVPNANIHLIPNGVDLEYFSPREETADRKTMVFTGLMNYYPNDHGILWFLDEIFPHILTLEPEARIVIVGANPSKNLLRRASKSIIITGYVDDVRPYIARSEVYVIPLRIGGGTRLKALEAMAMKKPIVSTRLGCEGIDLRHEESVLFADEPKEFARMVIRMFGDAALRARLTKNAYDRAVTQHGWQAIGKDLEHVHQSLVAGHGSQGNRQ